MQRRTVVGRPRRPVERAQSVSDIGPQTAGMKSPRKVGRRALAAQPKALRRRGAARVRPGSPTAGPAAEGVFESRVLDEAGRGAVNGSVEAVTEAESPRESEQAVGVAGCVDPDAGERSEGQSPPLLEEH